MLEQIDAHLTRLTQATAEPARSYFAWQRRQLAPAPITPSATNQRLRTLLALAPHQPQPGQCYRNAFTLVAGFAPDIRYCEGYVCMAREAQPHPLIVQRAWIEYVPAGVFADPTVEREGVPPAAPIYGLILCFGAVEMLMLLEATDGRIGEWIAPYYYHAVLGAAWPRGD